MDTHRAGGIDVVRVPFEGYAGRGEAPNCWFVPEKPVMLVDAGISSPGNLALVEGALAAFGLALADVATLVLTHWHWDHAGLAQEIAARSGAVICVHEAERARLCGTPGEFQAVAGATRRFYLRHGLDEALAEALVSLAFEHERADVPAGRARIVRDGDTVQAGPHTFTVVHTPGHTPGSICLLAAGDGALFSADTLYGRLFPHPVAEVPATGDQTRSALRDYPATLDRLRALNPAHVYPGHGAPFGPATKVIDPIASFIERRAARLTRMLAAERLSAADAVKALFPKADELDRCHAVAEVILLLEVLEARGVIARDEDGGVFRYRRI